MFNLLSVATLAAIKQVSCLQCIFRNKRDTLPSVSHAQPGRQCVYGSTTVVTDASHYPARLGSLRDHCRSPVHLVADNCERTYGARLASGATRLATGFGPRR